MKIIGLLPVKNESWILETYLKNVLPIVDEIIAIDDNSTDNSKEILLKNNVKVYDNDNIVNAGWSEFSIRQKLLHLGRESNGTHFVCLDADETFTSQFVPMSKKIIQKLQPNQKIAMQWLALWKSMTHYRDDKSVWSNNFKDFIFCDDGKVSYINPGNTIGVGRTPGNNTDENWMKLNTKYGAVLHYQFSHWNNFQLKQAWYRCSELIMQGKQNAKNINNKYKITLDNQVFLRECPESWLKDLPNIDLINIKESWHLEKIKEFFKEYSKEYFKELDIWHIDSIKNIIFE